MATVSGITKVIEIDVKQSANAQAQVQAMAKSLGSIDDAAKKTAASAKTLEQQFSGMGAQMLKGLAFTAVTAGMVTAIATMRDMADKAQVLRSRMELVTGSTEAAGKAFTDITRIAVAQGQSMDAIGTLYEKISRQAKGLGVTQEGVSKLTEGFAASLRLSGAGAQQSEAAILQFSQALASGKLQGDEYRSMLENNSVFMYKLAEASGKTLGELKKMSTDGDLDLKFLRENLFKLGEDGQSALQKLIGDAAKLPMTFKQARENVATELTNLVDALTNTANKSESIFTRMAKAVAQGMRFAADNIRIGAAADAAEAAARAGKEVPSEGSDSWSTAGRRNFDRVVELREKADKLQAEVDNQRKRSTNQLPELVEQGLAETLKDIRGYRARAEAIVKEMAAVNADRAQTAVPDRGQELLVRGWKPEPDPGKKDKKGGSTALDSLYEYQNKLNTKGDNLIDKDNGMGPNELKLEEAIDRTKLKGNELSKLIDTLREKARALDYDILARGWEDDMQKQKGKVAETQVKENAKLIDEYVKKAESREKKTDPLGDFVTEVENLNKVIDMIRKDPILGTPEQTKALEEYRENLNATTEPLKKVKTIAEEISDAMINSTKDMADAIINFTTGTEKRFGDMLANILRSIASAQLQKALNPLMKEGGDWLTGALTALLPAAAGTFSPGAGAGLNGLTAETVYGAGSGWGQNQAMGGGWRNGVQFFAKGGVVNSPTGFAHSGGMGVMGEAGAEAIMPLRRDASGKLGVGTAPVSIEINNYADATVTQSESVDDNGNRRITLMIEKQIEQGMAAGRYDKVMRSNYGINRLGR